MFLFEGEGPPFSKLKLLSFLYDEEDNLSKNGFSCQGIADEVNAMAEREVRDVFYESRRIEVPDCLSREFARFVNDIGYEALAAMPLSAQCLNLRMARKDLNEDFVRRYVRIIRDAYRGSELLSIYSCIGLKLLSYSFFRRRLFELKLSPCVPVRICKNLCEFYDSVLSLSKLGSSSDTDGATGGALVSVIITVFNPNVEYLMYSIKSILRQSYRDFEIILVDDCSSIKIHKDICSFIESLDEGESKRIEIIRNEENVGQYISRNRALAISKGEYFCIQDDDDISHPERLESQVRFLEAHPSVKACFTRHVRFDSNLNASVDDKNKLSVFGDGPATLMCRSSVISEMGGFNSFRSRGDVDFRERLVSHFGNVSIGYIEKPLYFMRASMGSVSSVYEYFHGDRLAYYRDVMKLKTIKNTCLSGVSYG